MPNSSSSSIIKRNKFYSTNKVLIFVKYIKKRYERTLELKVLQLHGLFDQLTKLKDSKLTEDVANIKNSLKLRNVVENLENFRLSFSFWINNDSKNINKTKVNIIFVNGILFLLELIDMIK